MAKCVQGVSCGASHKQEGVQKSHGRDFFAWALASSRVSPTLRLERQLLPFWERFDLIEDTFFARFGHPLLTDAVHIPERVW